MNNTPRLRAHPAAGRMTAAVLSALLGTALVACGNGQDTAPTGPDTPPALADYRLAIAAHDGSVSHWAVVDPLSDTAALDLPGAADPPSSARSVAVRVDTATRSATRLGDRLLVYVAQEQLYLIDLLGSAQPTPQRIGAADRLCTLSALVPLRADGGVAALAVTQRPAGAGDCSGPLDTLLLRTDSAASEPGLNLGGARLLAGLPAADLSVGTLLLSRPGTGGAGESLQLRDATLAALPDLALGTAPAGATARFLGLDPSAPGLGYAAVGRQVRALRWSGPSVTVDATAVQALAGDAPVAQGAADGVYLVDDGAVHRLAGGVSTLLGRIDARTGPPYDLARTFRSVHLTDTHVLVDSRASGLATTGSYIANLDEVHALPRSGGTPQALLSAITTDFIPRVNALTTLGSTGQRLLVAQSSCGSLGCARQLYDVDPQAGTATLGPLVAGVLQAASAPIGTTAPVTRRLVCPVDCRIDLQEQRASDGGAAVSLGPLGEQQVIGWLAGIEGLPLGFSAGSLTTDASGRSDAWLLRPGVAGSLRRLTQHLP